MTSYEKSYLLNVLYFILFIPAPTAPRDLTVDSAGETRSLTVTWTAPERMNGELAYYEVQYSYSGGDTLTEKVYDGTSTVLEGLQPCTTYGVKVLGVTGGGPGPKTEEKNDTTIIEGMLIQGESSPHIYM